MVKTKRQPILRNGTQPIEAAPPKLLKLDFGAGMNPREGFEGVDICDFGGKVKHVLNLVGRQHSVRCALRAGGACDCPSDSPKMPFKPWPWPDNSVEEAHASHFLEHLTNLDGRWERVHFFNELHRVLIVGGKCTFIIPYWCSARYYGDPSHKEPFSEWGCLYLNREWRLGCPEKGMGANAPHADIQFNPDGYSCDFDWTYGHNLHPTIVLKNPEAQQFCVQFYKEAAQDLVFTVAKRP